MTDPTSRLTAHLADRYALERELGQGGMATVYLAEDIRHRRKVAIKVLHPELSAVLGPERFLKEIELTASLQHPHILPLFDSGSADGLLYYVMPYVEGETLRSRLEREHQLPVPDALRIASEIAEALEYAHKRGVVHRDVKPENILLHDGRPLVADFGIALAVQEAGGARMTQTGISLGTPQYMAPEQAMGERNVDHRADIYALGAIVYEMLTGEPPFTGPNAQAIVARVLTSDPAAPSTKRRSVPLHVEEAVLTALEKMPADRFTSAGEFAAALRSGTTNAARAHARTATTIRARGWRSRARDPVVLALAAFALAAVVLGFVGVRPASAPGPTVRFTLSLPDGVSMTTSTQSIFALSPDGRTLAFAAREPSGAQRLFVRLLNEATARPLAGTDDAYHVFFSPDGEWLGFVSSSRLKKVRVSGGPVLTIADAAGIVAGASWSPRGEIIIVMGNGLMYALPENGGEPRRVCTRGSGIAAVYESSPHVTRDGQTVIYTSWSSQSVTSARLAAASLKSGECTVFDLAAVAALGFLDDYLIFVTDAEAMMAVRFDGARRNPVGAAQPLVPDVEVNQAVGTAQAALSASGSVVYQTSSPTTQLVLADHRGNLQSVTDEPRRYLYPRYSPDGRRIAMAVVAGAQRDVWVMDVAGGTLTRITSDGSLNERPEWTPDGSRVLYRTAKGRRSSIWWRPADLSGPEEPLLHDDREDYYEAVLSPDGRTIVYQLDTAGAEVVYRSVHGESSPVALAGLPFMAFMPRLSPDGRWIAYVSTESGADQVVVQPFPGPGPRVQVSVAGGSEPVWSRDGRRLFYRDNQHFRVASVSTSPTFTVLSREILFRDDFVKAPLPHANYDVTPDGTRLLLLKAAEQSQVIVIHNWRDELLAQLRRPTR